jgi:hypothetical protein
MNINPANFLSINEVLADVLVILDDQDQSLLTPGFYRAQVRNGLDELGFDISFLPVTNDYEIPDDLIVEMPKGCFNLRQIHLFTGTPDNVGYVENCYWKKGRHTRGANTGMTADVHHYNVTDPFIRVNVDECSLYYFSVQNGQIYLSDACSNFDYVRLTFDGIPSMNLDDVKMIPPEVRKAIVLWVTDKCAGALKMRDARYRIIQSDAINQLDEYGLSGAWHEAKMRLRRLDSKQMKDIIEYNSKLNA